MNTITMKFVGKLKYLLPLFALIITMVLVPAPAANANPLACNKKPAKPKVETPYQSAKLNTQRADLGWKTTDCATRYQVEVRQGTTWGRPVDAKYDLTDVHYRTRRLEKGRTYWWHVEACNPYGCKVSKWTSFSVMP